MVNSLSCKQLLSSGSSCNSTALSHALVSDPSPAPSQAAQAGQTEVLSLLLSAGFPASKSDELGITPLHLAALHGHADAVRSLLAAGAGLAVDALSAEGFSPLHNAALNGHAEVVRALLSAGASASQAHPCGPTALHLAARGGHAAAVELLLGAGAPPTDVDGVSDRLGKPALLTPFKRHVLRI